MRHLIPPLLPPLPLHSTSSSFSPPPPCLCLSLCVDSCAKLSSGALETTIAGYYDFSIIISSSTFIILFLHLIFTHRSQRSLLTMWLSSHWSANYRTP